MKLSDGKYQTATQVKVSSSETLFVGEVDSLLFLENNMMYSIKVSYASLSRGLRPWYDAERNLREPGRSMQFPRRGISADNLKKRGGRDDCMEVGLTHSRGVVGVTSYVPERKGDLKGLASVRSGSGQHSLYAEREELWKRN